jgi:hypothetical protein
VHSMTPFAAGHTTKQIYRGSFAKTNKARGMYSNPKDEHQPFFISPVFIQETLFHVFSSLQYTDLA